MESHGHCLLPLVELPCPAHARSLPPALALTLDSVPRPSPVSPLPQDHRWMRTMVRPYQRPLKLFDGNTVHSTGYFW